MNKINVAIEDDFYHDVFNFLCFSVISFKILAIFSPNLLSLFCLLVFCFLMRFCAELFVAYLQDKLFIYSNICMNILKDNFF